MTWRIMQGDCRSMLATLPDSSVQTCVTSPPYWGLRDYGVDGQLGLEPTPDEYVENMISVFREVRRVLRDDGTLWLNLGDTTKNKNLVGIPWRVAFALQSDGWYLRSDIIWAKPNPMPESVTDRPTKAHEYLFLMSKSDRYHYDADALREPHTWPVSQNTWESRKELGKYDDDRDASNLRSDNYRAPGGVGAHPLGRNKRSVWTVTSQPFADAHFATFPPKLIEPCIMAGAPVGGVVLDPFNGAGTTGVVATRLQRSYIGIELNPQYVAMSRRRIEGDAPLFNMANGE